MTSALLSLRPCFSCLRIARNSGLALLFCGVLTVRAQSAGQAASASSETFIPRSSLAVIGGDYVLRPNDVVAVTVYGEPDLDREDRLVSDGTIMMPLVGRIRVAGQTSVQAAETIRRALAADYLVNPQVSVAITEAVKETFIILGQVASPGSHPLPPKGRMSLLEAIGSAGGFTRLASQSRITVKRQENGREVVYKVDGKSQAKSDQVQIFQIRSGDVITVPESLF